MPEEVTAKIILEQSGGSGGEDAKSREGRAIQKDINKKLQPISKFFGGGEGASLAAGIGVLGKTFGAGGALATALTGITGTLVSADRLEDVIKGMMSASENEEEKQTREDLNEEIKDGEVNMSTLADRINDTNTALKDAEENGKSMVDNFLNSDWDGLRENLGEFSQNIFQASQGMIDFIRAAGQEPRQSSGSGSGLMSRMRNMSVAPSIQQEERQSILSDALLIPPEKVFPVEQFLSPDLLSNQLPIITKSKGSTRQSLFTP